jgi:hypothetical protein
VPKNPAGGPGGGSDAHNLVGEQINPCAQSELITHA